jgi:hypothetical protein
MSSDLDSRLRRALRPVDPGEQFTQRVLTRIASEPAQSTNRAPRTIIRWTSAAFAVSIVLSILVQHEWQARRTQQGLAARRQLLEALRLASDKLDVAYRAVNDKERSSAVDEHHGA